MAASGTATRIAGKQNDPKQTDHFGIGNYHGTSNATNKTSPLYGKQAGWYWSSGSVRLETAPSSLQRFLTSLRRKPARKVDSMKIKVFDFFSGCGGASRGFQDAGMDIVFALDNDADARHTFQGNFPSVHFEPTDICKMSVDRIRSLVDAERPNPVLFCGCAPCQPFTKQNTQRRDQKKDDRLPLLSHFGSFVEGCKPDIVFIENVPGLQKFSDREQPFGGFLQSLEAAGYQFDHEPVSLMKYGVPQSRRRLVLLASRHGPIALPPKTNGSGTENPRYETVKDWIGQLPPITAGEEHELVPNHRAATLSELNLERIRATPEGGGHRAWPPDLRLDCHAKFKGYSDVYGRLSWSRPASGLTTRCTSYSNGRFGHPEQDRAISVREAACLQTFPSDFKFQGSLRSMSRQIGNAVPVRLAKIIGEHLIRHLNEVQVLV